MHTLCARALRVERSVSVAPGQRHEHSIIYFHRSNEGSSSAEQLPQNASNAGHTGSATPEYDAVKPLESGTSDASIEAAPTDAEPQADKAAQLSDNDDDTKSCGSSADIMDAKYTENVKRAHAKQLIEQYFYQLSNGCGDANCSNEHCASSGTMTALTPNEAAAHALYLYKTDAKLCNLLSRDQTARKSTETESSSSGVEMESSHR